MRDGTSTNARDAKFPPLEVVPTHAAFVTLRPHQAQPGFSIADLTLHGVTKETPGTWWRRRQRRGGGRGATTVATPCSTDEAHARAAGDRQDKIHLISSSAHAEASRPRFSRILFSRPRTARIAVFASTD